MRKDLKRRCACWVCLFLMLFVSVAWAEQTSAPPVVQVLETGEPQPFAPEAKLLRVDMLNVRTADCFLLTYDGQSMLVDCGNDGTGDRIVRALRRRGVSRLTYAMNTHPHRDHLGGYDEVLDKVGADMFFTAFPPDYDKEQKKLTKLLESLQIPVKRLVNGDTWMLGDVEITVYQWEKPTTTLNNQSMAMHVRLGERALFLGADLETRGQQAIAAMAGDALQADILKMPHHGIAPTTRELLAAVSPVYCVFTNTRYCIEASITQLKRRKSPYAFTVEGIVEWTTDGKIWTVRQERKK